MGKKSTPKAPPAPDPYKVAAAQAEANKDTAIAQTQLNNMNQYSPGGSITYNQIGTWADGTPRFEQRMEYSPEQQALYDQQNQIAQSLGGLAQDNIGRVAEAQSQNLDFSNFQPLQGVTAPGDTLKNVAGAGAIQTGYGQGGPLTSGVDPKALQMGLDYSGVQGLPDPSSYNQAAQTASDSAYAAVASRLDPMFAQRESDTLSRLANKGISENSDAYRRELDNFSRDKNDAYGQAAWQAFREGLAAQKQGYDQGLSTRQQGISEVNNQGAFANAAQAQNFGQGQANAALNNAAQGQQYEQNMRSAGFNNAAQDQAFQQNLAQAGFYNSANQQDFANNLTSANLNNSIRQQQIDEATYLRNLPLNDIAALLGTGGGVQQPEFQSFNTAGIAAPDLQGAVYNSYNAQMNQYNQQMANRNRGLGSIFGLAGTLGAAAISDRRWKENIKRVGTLANGIATYVFNYIGSTAKQFGVMAQEVLEIKPDAVGALPDGTLYVDYGKVF